MLSKTACILHVFFIKKHAKKGHFWAFFDIKKTREIPFWSYLDPSGASFQKIGPKKRVKKGVFLGGKKWSILTSFFRAVFGPLA